MQGRGAQQAGSRKGFLGLSLNDPRYSSAAYLKIPRPRHLPIAIHRYISVSWCVEVAKVLARRWGLLSGRGSTTTQYGRLVNEGDRSTI